MMEPQSVISPALLRDGVAAARAGDILTARSLLSQAAAAQPGSEPVWLWLAAVAETPREAISCWERVLEINPHQEQARSGLRRLLLQEGITLARTGEKSQARQLLLRSAGLDAENEIVWLWLASLADSPEEAVHYVRRVLEINPQHQRAIEWLALLHPKTWHCPICQALYADRVERCSACRCVLSLAQPEVLVNSHEADQALLQTAIARYESLPPADAGFDVHFNLGLAYLNQHRLNEGIVRLQEAGRLKPDDGELRAGLENLLHWLQPASATLSMKAIPKSGQRVVMVVDDSPTIRKLVTVTLEQQGYHVLTAAGGVEALNRLNEVVPDLILLDITMPHMDGYQLCRLIKGSEMTSQVPVVMLSGKDGFFDKVRGRMVGAAEYVTKPFEPVRLLQAVERNFSH
jgi:twitching motility two-component system response regulator PilG